MLLERGATLTGTGHDLNIGKNGIDMGELINHGTLTVRDLEVKPGNGCTSTIILPVIHNYANIITANDLHIGNNCGAGAFYNHSGGTVNVSNQIHLDNYLCNADTMYVATLIKNHGGTIDCCGYIETPYLDIDQNTGRPGTFLCTDICQSDGSDPVIDVANTIYADLPDAYNNAPSSDVSFHGDSTLVCSYNAHGMLMSLPIELILFSASVQGDGAVLLDWVTASETNNDFFTIERSQTLENWEESGHVNGAGNSMNTLSYSFTDHHPYPATSYYRLKQTDFDGHFEYSKVLSVWTETLNQQVSVFPNPAINNVSILGSAADLAKIRLFDSVGRDLTWKISIDHVTESQVHIDLSYLPPGSFTLQFKNSSMKLLKQPAE